MRADPAAATARARASRQSPREVISPSRGGLVRMLLVLADSRPPLVALGQSTLRRAGRRSPVAGPLCGWAPNGSGTHTDRW